MKFVRTETLKNHKTGYMIFPKNFDEESAIVDFLEEHNACIGKED